MNHPFKRKTIDGVVSTFTNTIHELNKLAATHTARATRADHKAGIELARVSHHENESARAAKFANNIEKMLNE